MIKIVAKVLIGFGALIILFAGYIQFQFSREQAKQFQSLAFAIQNKVATADVDLGKRLYAVRSGCVDCHGSDLSGVKVMDNWAMGTIYGANITPYALSQWTDEEIARAIRYGIHKSGRSLRFMPSYDYQGLSLEDIASLVTYLRKSPPVEKKHPENTFGPIAKMLAFLGKMPVMFPAKAMDLQRGFNTKPEEQPTIEFGKYLANSCVGCHGPELSGGKIPGGDPSWPEALNIRLGSNPQWTEATFIETIKTGNSPTTKHPLRAPMPVGQLAQMNDVELKALWLYLSSLK